MRDAGRPQAPLMSNPRADRVRDVAKLSGRPARLKRGQFLAEGPQAVREALLAHRREQRRGGGDIIAEVFATAQCLQRLPELAELTESVPVRLATDEVLAALADTVNSQGIVAVCRTVDVPLEAVLGGEPTLIAVFAQMRDPGNAGTVLRAADAAGADAVIISSSSVDIYNPKAVRSSAGSLFHLPIVVGEDIAAVASALRRTGITILAADGHGDRDLDSLQEAGLRGRLGQSPGEGDGAFGLEQPSAWLFGNEAQGLSSQELDLADYRVAVPIYGGAESLNLAAAAALCLYASARAQRR